MYINSEITLPVHSYCTLYNNSMMNYRFVNLLFSARNSFIIYISYFIIYCFSQSQFIFASLVVVALCDLCVKAKAKHECIDSYKAETFV